MTDSTTVKFFVTNKLGNKIELRGATDWASAGDLLDEMYANAGKLTVSKETFLLTNKETKIFDTDWEGYGPKGYE